ncbi:MAG: flagellar hook capping FlgD N-terminal domain-containing protein [Thermodesulfobacteriota bacterium]
MGTVDVTQLGQAAAQVSSVTSPVKTLGKEDFLKLLAVQLEHQDPLNPMENTEFIAQMAQFSTLEGITNMERSLLGMSTQMINMNNTSVTGLIGKHVKILGNQANFDGANPVRLGYILNGDAKSVNITITDGSGNIVRTLTTGAAPAGPSQTFWDGLDHTGRPVSPGEYNFSVNATEVDGNPVSGETVMTDMVDGVVYEGGKPYLIIGSLIAPMTDVLEVYGN